MYLHMEIMNLDRKWRNREMKEKYETPVMECTDLSEMVHTNIIGASTSVEGGEYDINDWMTQ